jgi:hypothetical protein
MSTQTERTHGTQGTGRYTEDSEASALNYRKPIASAGRA